MRWLVAATAALFSASLLVVRAIGTGGFWVFVGAWIVGMAVVAIGVGGYFRGAYSDAGVVLFTFTLLAFQGWSAIVFWVGFLVHYEPAGWTFALVEATALLPLVTGFIVISRKLKAVP